MHIDGSNEKDIKINIIKKGRLNKIFEEIAI
jgi:hypothetical protein